MRIFAISFHSLEIALREMDWIFDALHLEENFNVKSFHLYALSEISYARMPIPGKKTTLGPFIFGAMIDTV